MRRVRLQYSWAHRLRRGLILSQDGPVAWERWTLLTSRMRVSHQPMRDVPLQRGSYDT